MRLNRSSWCVHWVGVQHGCKCEAGIDLKTFNNGQEFGFLKAIPCFGEGSNTCSLRKTKTPAELIAEDDEIQASINRAAIVREAIVKACPTHGQGEIACPCCGGIVKYSVAQVNGHVLASCSTEGCASWME